MMMLLSPHAAWVSHLGMSKSFFHQEKDWVREKSILLHTCGYETYTSHKPGCHPKGWNPWRAVASFLFEEGCHSAGFVTTIHLGHHLLLSLGLRFNFFARAT